MEIPVEVVASSWAPKKNNKLKKEFAINTALKIRKIVPNETMNAFNEKLTRGRSLKAIQTMADKTKRINKGYKDTNAPPKKPPPKKPVKKIKDEVAKEITNAISAKSNDCFLNLYSAIANKIEQINKGRKKIFPNTTEIIKDTIPMFNCVIHSSNLFG